MERKNTKKHSELSAKFAQTYLDKWNITREEQEIILNSIQAHHNKIPTKTKIAEIVKNAECFKFVTIEGSLILLHELGKKNLPYKEAKEKVIEKMEQKMKLLTLDSCILEAKENCKEIKKIIQIS